jgi:NAD(P)-dependent dehydrogenase (short-subunit alcohol dehydrogenase family)
MPSHRRVIAGRPAMITGAASGIGRSLARRLSRSGSLVAIADVIARFERRLRSRQAGAGRPSERAR